MVELRGVSKVYARGVGGRVEALLDVTVEVKPGETVVVSGPSGAGKSTLLRLVTGEERPTRGTVKVLDEDVRRLGRRGLARLRRELGIVSQSRPLLEDQTAFANVALVLRALGRSRGEAWEAARETLAEVGLDEQRRASARELAEADRLWLCLARALAPGPRLLVLDEPTTGLDAAALGGLAEVLRPYHDQGTTILIATQSSGLAGRLEARTVTLERGHLQFEGRVH
jgi:cell division transport system ATP-binding protein